MWVNESIQLLRNNRQKKNGIVDDTRHVKRRSRRHRIHGGINMNWTAKSLAPQGPAAISGWLTEPDQRRHHPRSRRARKPLSDCLAQRSNQLARSVPYPPPGKTTAMLLSPGTRKKRQVVTLPCNSTRSAARRLVQVQGKTAACASIRVSGTTLFDTRRGPRPELARYWLSSATIHVVFGCRPLLVQENMGNNKKKPVWEKNSRGFWLAVCLVLSALAGWLMFHLGLLH